MLSSFYWLLLLGTMFPRFILIVACLSTSFLFMAEYYSNAWIHHFSVSTHQLMDMWVFTFWLLWRMCYEHLYTVFVWSHVFNSLRCVSRSKNAESYENAVQFLKNCQTVLTKWLHHFIFSLAMYKGSNFPTLLPIPLVIVHILISAILVRVKWYLIVALIGISLITNDVEQLSHVLIGHFYIFPGEISIQPPDSFLNWVITIFI